MPEGIITTNAAEIAALLRANEQATAEALKAEAVKIKGEVLADYRRTVATWHHRVGFESMVDTQADGSFSVMVGTDDKIYGYVDKGTPAHIIRPRFAKALRFLNSYRAKTSPGVIGSHGGGSSGVEVFRQIVHHPGTKARKFTETIFNKHKREFFTRISRALAGVWGK